MKYLTETQSLVKLHTLSKGVDFERRTCPFVNKNIQASITAPWAALELGMKHIYGCHFEDDVILPMKTEARVQEEINAAEELWEIDEPLVIQYTYDFSPGYRRPEKFLLSRGFCVDFADLCADSNFCQRLDYETGYRAARSHEPIWRTSNGMAGDRFIGRAESGHAMRSAMFKKIQELRESKHSSNNLLIQ